MESSAPFPIEPGERVLAAIIFTDVVNFSARVQAAEISTLSLLEQDFAVMTKYCERYQGWVLKSTGDGLLLYFTSAVHAVTCALQIQQFFLKRTKTQTATQTLTHRIGVHLGDVFVKDHDVMGDGVNIASRLQSVADPGGVCISQTVYDVVKNKLALSVERLAPRDLKNISEIGGMYRVLLEPRQAAPTSTQFNPPARTKRPTFTPTEKLIGAIVVALGLAAIGRLIFQANSSHQEALAESQATQAALDAWLRDKKPAPAVKTEVAAPVSPVVEKLPEDNFAELARNVDSRKTRSDAENARLRQHALESSAVTIAWVNATMRRYSSDAPLLVPRMNASMPAGLKAYAASDNRFVFTTGGAARARGWDELKLVDQEALILGTLLNSASPPPAEVMRGAEAFAYLHDLPEMVATLREQRVP